MSHPSRESIVPPNCRQASPEVTSPDGTACGLVWGRDGALHLHVRGDVGPFAGEVVSGGKLCPLIPENASVLSDRCSWLRPRRIPEDRVSFGFGDRLGSATPGHIRSIMESRSVFPVLAQQSVRENTRTGRTFAQVLADAIFGSLREGYDSGFGADADHLIQIDDALEAARAGFTFFTCDPGAHVAPAESMSLDELRIRFEDLPEAGSLRQRYEGQSFRAGNSLSLRFSEETLLRTAVKYGGAVEHAARMYRALADEIGPGFDYEVSVDETEAPTTPLEHLFVALELRHRGVDFVSLAPRFVGAMEKGVDWRGDIVEFAQELDRHAAIAESVGGYRLSLHSGSDKFTIYPLVTRATKGRCHVKTAGTSYLVALDVIAQHDPSLFRQIAVHSLAAFAEDKATYHISADPAKIRQIAAIPDDELSDLVDAHDSRQVLHVAYGSVLHSPLAEDFHRVLAENEEAHFDALRRHLGRHIDALEVNRNG